ncbi:lipoate protein ligase C-terminal domain-containing protein [Castellaniella caeni]|uniref:lipoate protein ligase C-terminal domain-containing protein n=1 Tax=Castellaniella caeni TaxID=266123 RepID=UPI000C9F05ED|nr:lipoate protein ligase C-terminal domain-containing protein [Castellaniella caeni]
MHEIKQPLRAGHGEYKIPGGKLVVIDLSVEAGHLKNVQLSGDFFLEPPEALDAINAALEGLPCNAGAAGLAQAVREALSDDVQMFGISPEGVAVAVERALA